MAVPDRLAHSASCPIVRCVMQSLPDFGLDLEDAASMSPRRSMGGARTVSRCTVQSNLPDERRCVAV